MTPNDAYKQRSTAGMTRVDMLLALFDSVVEQLKQAHEALAQNDSESARPFLAKAQLIVAGLASGIDPGQGELAVNSLRLYEFVSHCLHSGTVKEVEAAVKLLEILRDGFLEIRTEAVQLERAGTIPPADTIRLLQASV